jgi:hypothetical protein
MHLARVENEKNGDSHPPTGHDGKTRQLYVGCSGWFYWHWRGTFYPADLPTSRWFAHYAGRFKTVELNAPFYSWPTVATVGSWIRQAGRHQFVYTVKVCELITHIKRFAGTKTLVRDFGLIADLLGPRMGCFLFQLPPSFHYTPARLKRILDQLDHRRRNVVEFRHKSWWNETVYAAFRRQELSFALAAVPGCPMNCSRQPMTSTSAFMASRTGIGTTIRLWNWLFGPSASKRAAPKPCGLISTMTGADTLSRTHAHYLDCCCD